MQVLIFALFLVWTLNYLCRKKKDSRLILPHDHLVFFITFLPLIFFILLQATPIPEGFIKLISHGLFDLKERIGLSDAVTFPSSLSINRYETFTALFQVTSCFLTVIITSILFRKHTQLKTGVYFIAFELARNCEHNPFRRGRFGRSLLPCSFWLDGFAQRSGS